MAYQALYRTWRPERFADVVGQEAIIRTLTNQIASGRIAHAYLFCGSRGTGKTTVAKIMARAVSCENPVDGDLCLKCTSCQELVAENNMDIIEIDAASNNGVDDIRDLREKIKYPPSVGKYKVYIIDEVHMLSTGAFNALLKTLEEPPQHAVFILATTEPQKLPATILSRCQRFDFRRIAAHKISAHLNRVLKSVGAEQSNEATDMIARAAEGGMRDAISILDMCLSYGDGQVPIAIVREVLGTTDRSFLFEFTGALLAGDAQKSLVLLDKLIRLGRELPIFVKDVTEHFRCLMVAKTVGNGISDLLDITKEDEDSFIKQAATTNQSTLLRAMNLFIQLESELKWASQTRAIVEMYAVRVCKAEEENNPEALIARIAQLEEKIANGAVVASAPKAIAANQPKVTEKAIPTPVKVISGSEQEIFTQATQLIKKQNISYYSPLTKAKFLGLEGNKVKLAFPPGSEIYSNLLQRDAVKELINTTMSQVFGKPVEIVLVEDVPKAQPSANKNQLVDIYDIFGRENVQIIDE